MKLSILFMLSFMFVGLFSSCSKKVINPLEYDKPKVTFGHGGGFAGIEKSYVMLENGKIFQLTEMGKSYTYLGQIKRNQVTQFFETFKLFTFDKVTLDDPGNMYKYIETSYGGEVHRLTWGNSSVDTNLTLLYQILMNNITILNTNK